MKNSSNLLELDISISPIQVRELESRQFQETGHQISIEGAHQVGLDDTTTLLPILERFLTSYRENSDTTIDSVEFHSVIQATPVPLLVEPLVELSSVSNLVEKFEKVLPKQPLIAPSTLGYDLAKTIESQTSKETYRFLHQDFEIINSDISQIIALVGAYISKFENSRTQTDNFTKLIGKEELEKLDKEILEVLDSVVTLRGKIRNSKVQVEKVDLQRIKLTAYRAATKEKLDSLFFESDVEMSKVYDFAGKDFNVQSNNIDHIVSFASDLYCKFSSLKNSTTDFNEMPYADLELLYDDLVQIVSTFGPCSDLMIRDGIEVGKLKAIADGIRDIRNEVKTLFLPLQANQIQKDQAEVPVVQQPQAGTVAQPQAAGTDQQILAMLSRLSSDNTRIFRQMSTFENNFSKL